MLKKRLKKLFFQRENLLILLVFVLFFLFKTQFQNLIILSLDHIWLEGAISKIFTYNYTGELIGCEEVLKSQKILGDKSQLFYKSTTSVFFILSLISYLFLLNRIKKHEKFDVLCWILLALFSFHLFDAVQFFLFHFDNLYQYVAEDKFLQLLCLEYCISLVIALILFLKYMNTQTKINSICIGIPSTYFGIVLWRNVGELIMPINYL